MRIKHKAQHTMPSWTRKVMKTAKSNQGDQAEEIDLPEVEEATEPLGIVVMHKQGP